MLALGAGGLIILVFTLIVLHDAGVFRRKRTPEPNCNAHEVGICRGNGKLGYAERGLAYHVQTICAECPRLNDFYPGGVEEQQAERADAEAHLDNHSQQYQRTIAHLRAALAKRKG